VPAKPTKIKSALQRVLSKTPVESRLTSAEWAHVPLALRERSQFSARVDDLRVVQAIQDGIEDALRQDPEKAFQNKAKFVRDMRQAMGAEEGDSGAITDITSNRRLATDSRSWTGA